MTRLNNGYVEPAWIVTPRPPVRLALDRTIVWQTVSMNARLIASATPAAALFGLATSACTSVRNFSTTLLSTTIVPGVTRFARSPMIVRTVRVPERSEKAAERPNMLAGEAAPLPPTCWPPTLSLIARFAAPL